MNKLERRSQYIVSDVGTGLAKRKSVWLKKSRQEKGKKTKEATGGLVVSKYVSYYSDTP